MKSVRSLLITVFSSLALSAPVAFAAGDTSKDDSMVVMHTNLGDITIEVAPGTYSETLLFDNDDITLRGVVEGAEVEQAADLAVGGARDQLAGLDGAEPVPVEHPDDADPRAAGHRPAAQGRAQVTTGVGRWPCRGGGRRGAHGRQGSDGA